MKKDLINEERHGNAMITLDSCALLEERLGVQFRDRDLLLRACTHKSYANEQNSHAPRGEADNERLEFLGDAVLDLVLSELLVEVFPEENEGTLSKLRASLVNEKILAELARELGAGEFVRLGKGEERTGGREKDSILAGSFEAIVAAIHQDGGLESARRFTRKLFEPRLSADRPPQTPFCDFKTQLQELSQARLRVAPRYTTVGSTGPDHAKTFEVEVQVGEKISARATGRSKKEAEQNAARLAMEAWLPSEQKERS